MPDTSRELIVFKYRNWTDQFHKDVLLKNELFFAPPASLNDPYDHLVPTNLQLLDTDAKRREYAESIGKRFIDQLPAAFYQRKQEQFIYDLEHNTHALQCRLEQIESNAYNSHYGVLSLSFNCLSKVMWSQYSDKHQGYCIGFYENLLQNVHEQIMGGPIAYSDEYPQVHPLEDLESQVWKKRMRKAKGWEYEAEYRIVRGFNNPPSDNDRILVLPNHFIAEVIIGAKACDQTKSEILAVCREKGIRVFQAKLMPFQYEISKELLS